MKMVSYTHICHFSLSPRVESEMMPLLRPLVQAIVMSKTKCVTYLMTFNNDKSKSWKLKTVTMHLPPLQIPHERNRNTAM
jgi:hypothetical protein